jgi:DNA recombination protein RmuC
MPETLLALIIGLLTGGAVAYFIAKSRAERAASEKLRQSESAAAGAAAREEELRRQAERQEGELSSLRETLASERQARARAETELTSSMQNLNEQKALLENMKKEMTDTFNALSGAALKSSSEDFLRLASERLGKLVLDTKGKLGEHKEAMDGLIKPLNEALKKYEVNIHAIELKRRQDYTSLDEQIKHLATTHRELQKETGNLVTALRKPHIRGRWGEITLRNVVELAGMSSHCDFTEQVSLTTEEGRLRPDMVVHMPGGHDIVVDSKVSMEALLESASAENEEARREHLKRHAGHVRQQVERLGSKPYWQQFDRSPELAVLFISEAALAAALENLPTLIEDSMNRKVLVSTPTTLFALLSAVAYGWRQERITKNAEVIATLGKELYGRVAVWMRHINEIGAALAKSTEAYNRAVASMETRVLPSVRKFKELGTATPEEIPETTQVEQAPRNLSLPSSEA